MKNLTSQQVRETWLNFFHERGHMIEPGASLIPQNDPTLLWINAGVAALKKYFDGSMMPPSKRITNVQKCIRTNDIDNVGRTARHHTFFEMLGNFSIGDYFRKEIIPWAFEILTSPKYFDMDKNKLYVTYHPTDLETKELWIKQGLDESHLIPLEDNFWQIGEGPCGPNTEVFYDRGEKYDPKNLGKKLIEDDIENDRYIEIWGIVFSQFNAVNGVKRKDYKELPHKNIDTGAGLERIACVLQNAETNFETDLFMPIIKDLEKISKTKYEGKNLMPYRVIADHIRACTFALADGASFSNEGRGYVLRRLLRRAMRYGQQLGLYEPFMYKLVGSVIKVMKDFYPYLIDKKEYLEKVIHSEEDKFIKTLNSGEALLSELIKNKKELSGKDAFKLYDTYGFPLELTKEICFDNGVNINLEEFDKCLNEQKERARLARKNIESFAKQSKDLLEFTQPSVYSYDDKDLKGEVIGLFKNGTKVDVIDDEGDVIFNKTNFYAEMGGQVADCGIIKDKNFEAKVDNVFVAPNGQHIHHIKVDYGTLKVSDAVLLSVDHLRHEAIKMNHSATHLLQAALISILGDSIKQKGSYVDDKYLRFDFSYNDKVKDSDLVAIEKKVNEFIYESIPEKTLILTLDEAKKTGAIAEFDEKYQDKVRVVCFGEISKEFCGGNHVENTHDIGLFVITHEGAIASGIRRIEALSGIEAYKYLKDKELHLKEIMDKMNALNILELDQKVNSLINSLKEEKVISEQLNQKISKYEAEGLLKDVKNINGKNILIKYYPNYSKDFLITLYDQLKTKIDDYVIVLIGSDLEKHPIIVGVAKNIISNDFNANKIIKKISSCLGGNGGGKPDLAQGSVINIGQLEKVEKVFEGE